MKKISNFFQIYIKSDIRKILKLKKKNTYKNKNIVGIHIEPEYPTRPHIILENNFDKSVKKLSKELVIEINKEN